MSSVNKAIILGRCGKDPEIKSFASGDKIANFSIATTEAWRDKSSGERREKTDWHNIVVKNENIIRTVENYVKKGSKVYIEGQIQTRKWQDQNGNDKYVTEIVIGRFNGALTLLDGRKLDDGYTEKDALDSQMRVDAGLEDEIPF